MNAIRRRPATLNDIDQLLVFMEKFYAIDGYPFHKERIHDALTEFISQKNLGAIWIIETTERPIGYVVLAVVYSFEFGGKNAFVDEFYLEPEYRGKGIGREMMEWICSEAQHRGINALHLEVEHHNAAAMSLYRKFNFNDHHRVLMTRMLNE